jgi:F0F1-type ATP synthase delta subunit
MDIKLPLNIVSPVDLNRLVRELKSLEEFFIAAKSRPAGMDLKLPTLTRSLDEVAKENNYNLLEEEHRQTLYKQLSQIVGDAPLIHISFAAEPSPKALEKLIMWFRTNIHSYTLLQVGLQPTIAAGCVVRTTNKVFDMSLREHLHQQQKFLAQLIDTAAKQK